MTQPRRNRSTHTQGTLIQKKYTQLLEEKRKHTGGLNVLDIIQENETPSIIQAKEEVMVHIHHLKTSANTQNDALNTAITSLCGILENALTKNNPKRFFEDNIELIKERLKTVQYSKASLLNSMLNATAMVLVCCSIVVTFGLAYLAVSDLLKHNRTTKGDCFLFFTKGEKQQIQETMHHIEQSTTSRSNPK
ncbi:MAG: hypothetical protein CK424_06065 [Legionella sp.]|nr:MAG: hypothetical protein CK424_06065 [Legionella sp.]